MLPAVLVRVLKRAHASRFRKYQEKLKKRRRNNEGWLSLLANCHCVVYRKKGRIINQEERREGRMFTRNFATGEYKQSQTKRERSIEGGELLCHLLILHHHFAVLNGMMV